MKRLGVVLGILVATAVAGCPSGDLIQSPDYVDVGQPIQGGIHFSVSGTTDSTIDVVIGWTAPSSARPLAAFAVELLASINTSPPDSLVFADTVPATQLTDSTTLRRTLPGDTLFVKAGVRAQNDRGMWGGLGQSPVIRIVVEDLGPGTPDVSIDTITGTIATESVIVSFANALCVGSNCELVVGDSVQACAILILSNGVTGLATGSPAVCEDTYLAWLNERAL